MGNVLSGPPPTINIAEVPNMVLKDTLGAIPDPRRCGMVLSIHSDQGIGPGILSARGSTIRTIPPPLGLPPLPMQAAAGSCARCSVYTMRRALWLSRCV